MLSQQRDHTRLGALDGLRGVAAVIVVVWHAMLTTQIARFAPIYLGPENKQSGDPRSVGTLEWLLLDTPLRVFSMGTNAVIIFFVLSGFVLTLPMLRGRSLDLWAYYPRRVVRLWVPAAASLVLAFAIILLTHQDPAHSPSSWGQEYAFDRLELGRAISSFFLITGSHAYNNPLWSLEWEMLFSLFLPVAFLGALFLKNRLVLWGAIIACGLASAVGAALTNDTLLYAPTFMVGVFAAKLHHTRIVWRSPATSWALVIGGWILICVPDIARSTLGVDPFSRIGHALMGFVCVGAGLVVLGLTISSPLTRLFASAPLAFLGRISFSLYLVHAPILLAGVHVFGSASTALFATVPVSVLVAWLFMRFVEEPSARLARRVGAACSTAVGTLRHAIPQTQEKAPGT